MARRSKALAPRARERRDPEEARRVILDAAERVFAAHGPDAVGLKDVAGEAGVSHALVSHYFGTYTGLVDAVLERRAAAARASVFAKLGGPDTPPDAASLLDALWSWVSDPLTLRLAAWAVLTGRARAEHFFPGRVKGLRRVADALEPRLKRRRDDIEFVLAAAVALAFGHSLVGPAIAVSLGRGNDAGFEKMFRARVVEMLQASMARP